jgi:hypothetical protein
MICLLICLTTDAAFLKVSHHREATAPEASAHILQMPAPSCEFKSTTLTNVQVYSQCLMGAFIMHHTAVLFLTLKRPPTSLEPTETRDAKASLSHQPAGCQVGHGAANISNAKPTDTDFLADKQMDTDTS